MKMCLLDGAVHHFLEKTAVNNPFCWGVNNIFNISYYFFLLCNIMNLLPRKGRERLFLFTGLD